MILRMILHQSRRSQIGQRKNPTVQEAMDQDLKVQTTTPTDQEATDLRKNPTDQEATDLKKNPMVPRKNLTDLTPTDLKKNLRKNPKVQDQVTMMMMMTLKVQDQTQDSSLCPEMMMTQAQVMTMMTPTVQVMMMTPTVQDQTDLRKNLNHTTIPNPDHGMRPTLDLIWDLDQDHLTDMSTPDHLTPCNLDQITVLVSVHQTTLTQPALMKDHPWDHLTNQTDQALMKVHPQVPLTNLNGLALMKDHQWDHLITLIDLAQTQDHPQVPLTNLTHLAQTEVHQVDHLINMNTPDPQTQWPLDLIMVQDGDHLMPLR
jgi:hypothetical protein